MTIDIPELGTTLQLGDLRVNVHDTGSGQPVLLIHGSGPGVSAWANWRGVIPRLSPQCRLIAPDMVGFGYTEAPQTRFDIDLWLRQLTGVLDTLGVDRFSIIGNSFGGAMALHFAHRFPERVDKLVLMGPVGTAFPITEGLEKVWGYEPSPEAMEELMEVFAHDPSFVTRDLVRARFEASRRPTVQERYAALFPAPRQRWVDAIALDDRALGEISCDVLVVHGRDDQVIPLAASRRLVEQLPSARLEIVPECGHWVQIEHLDEFCDLVTDFLITSGASR